MHVCKKLKMASTQIMQFPSLKLFNKINRSKFLVNIPQSNKLYQVIYQHIIPSIASIIRNDV